MHFSPYPDLGMQWKRTQTRFLVSEMGGSEETSFQVFVLEIVPRLPQEQANTISKR